MCRPACRIIHTGGRSTGSPRAQRRRSGSPEVAAESERSSIRWLAGLGDGGDDLVVELKYLCYGPAGYSFDTTGEAVNVHLDSQKRVDAIARNPYKADAPDAIDFTIGMPMGKSYLSVDATLDPTYVTAKLERDKIHKHASKAKELGMQFMPIAFTTYGGMGDEFLKKRWRPFYKELMAEELKAGGKGWKTRKRQQRALEKLSIVLARENGAMIARATSWQQAVATRP